MSTESSELSVEEGFLPTTARKHEDRGACSFQVSFDDSHRFKAVFRT